MDIREDIDSMTFEEAIQTLEKVVNQLEEGKLDLSKSISLYEYASKLKQFCEKQISSAEKRIEQVISQDENVYVKQVDDNAEKSDN